MKITKHFVLVVGTAIPLAVISPFEGLGIDWPAAYEGKAGADAIATYATAKPKPSELIKSVMATGTLNATLNVDVGSQLSGQVVKLFVDFNDKVAKGQPLAELDQSSYIAQLDKCKAALEGAKAQVKVAEAQLAKADADLQTAILQKAVLAQRVDIAGIRFKIATADAERKHLLKARGVTSAVEVVDFDAKRQEAAATLREAQAVLSEQDAVIDGARIDVTKAAAELDSARASVGRLAADLASAKVDLSRTWIRSPVDGVVVGRLVNKGQTLATSLEAHTLFDIAGNLKNMDVYAHVDESDIGKIVIGQPATFTVDAFPGRQFKAVVKQIRKAPQVLQNVVTYTVVLASPNPDEILLPGMTTLTKIEVSRSKNALQIPVAALKFTPADDQKAAAPTASGEVPIWVVGSNGQPKKILVTIAADDGSHVTVRSDQLHASDRVIVGRLENAKPAGVVGVLAGF